MDLNEAIAHAKEVAKAQRDELILWEHRKEIVESNENNPKNIFDLPIAKCTECAKEHEQLAEWLEELKDYREGKRTCEHCKHQNKAEDQYPCSICRCNHANYFEWESEDNK